MTRSEPNSDILWLRDLFGQEERELAQGDIHLVYSSQTRLRRASRVIILFFGLLGLLGPILGLYFVQSRGDRFAVVCSAIILFSLIVAATTKARSVEILAAMAAYVVNFLALR
jgi:hypothetical protein